MPVGIRIFTPCLADGRLKTFVISDELQGVGERVEK
jgi:hypothetical protein